MPYTLSHPAVAVPVSRWLLRMRMLSAVIIGSVVPDFGYLMPVHPPRMETHSAVALITFCLPMGLLSFWIFQKIIKPAWVSILSNRVYTRWQAYAAPASLRDGRQWLLAACGVLAGAVTHLAWDGFTHEDARGVRMVPELADMLEVHGHVVSGARVLQGVSSLAGLALVIAAIVYALRPGRPVSDGSARVLRSWERRTWACVYAVALGCCWAAFMVFDHEHGGYRWLGLSSIAIGLLRALVPTLLGVSLLLLTYLRIKH